MEWENEADPRTSYRLGSLMLLFGAWLALPTHITKDKGAEVKSVLDGFGYGDDDLSWSESVNFLFQFYYII
jgi:hypothetical protein